VVHAVLGDYGEVALGPVTRALSIWSDSIPQIPFDTALARRSFGELGWRDTDGDGVLDRDGRPLEFELLVPSSSAGRKRTAQVLQDQFRRVGVAVAISEVDFNTLMERQRSGQFDAILGAYGGETSPGGIAEVWTAAGIGAFNSAHYVNQKVEQLVDEALNATEVARARERWYAVLSELNEDAGAIFLYVPKTMAGVHKRFENVTIRPDQWAATLWTWRVNPSRTIERDRLGAN
jgi:peptide/nickel transport system substrate-binding protein